MCGSAAGDVSDAVDSSESPCDVWARFTSIRPDARVVGSVVSCVQVREDGGRRARYACLPLRSRFFPCTRPLPRFRPEAALEPPAVRRGLHPARRVTARPPSC